MISIDIALWLGLYVIYNPVVSFDLRCQSGILQYVHNELDFEKMAKTNQLIFLIFLSIR